ncbi:GTP-binding protein [Arachnomyces sp. PD_36]|nr:GTP-binding protein [Arachnomyces sp. PD_36]
MARPFICPSCLSRPSPFLRRQSRLKSTSSTSASTASPTTYTPLSSLPPTSLSYYHDTHRPTPTQLSTANSLFTPSPPHTPVKLFSASKFRETPLLDDSPIPEVAFLGRSNVGKSSLLNALMGKEMCYTSSKPGRTREMNAFGVGAKKGGGTGMDSKVVVLDMPGYGKGSREEWGVEIMKYLRGRKQLRRVFLLVDAIHGLKPQDLQLLSLLRQSAIPHQTIVSKIDKILLPTGSTGKSHAALAKRGVPESRVQELREVFEELWRDVGTGAILNDGPGVVGEILGCSAQTVVRGVGEGGGRGKVGNKEVGLALGIEGVRWAVCVAAGIDGSVEAGREKVPVGGFMAPPPLYKEVDVEEGEGGEEGGSGRR